MFEKIKKIFKKKTKPVVETKRTYKKIKDHATDISYENEILNKSTKETVQETKSSTTFGV
jgi:hypothetical protein